jgi:RNA polymerase sigma-70 factor (ECF subfamily)
LFVATAAVIEVDFAEFYRVQFSRVERAVRPVAGAAAEDVAQEAFIAAHAKWDEVATFDVPYAWVRRVAMRIAGRRAHRDQMRTVLEAATAGHGEQREGEVDLALALADLPARAASAVRAHHLEDRTVGEVADRLGCSIGAAKLLLLRSRRRLAERVGGLAGRWISERRWTPDAIVEHLRAGGADEHADEILDDLDARGGRWELTIADGGYALWRDDGTRLDSGTCLLRGYELELVPARVPGRVLLRATIDGNRLSWRPLWTTSAPTRGVPDHVWVDLFWGSGPFGYAGRAQPTL